MRSTEDSNVLTEKIESVEEYSAREERNRRLSHTGWAVLEGVARESNPNSKLYADIFAQNNYPFGEIGSSFKIPDLKGEFLGGLND